MRICIVAEHASTRFGGEAILPVHYFRLLRSLGYECWLVVHERTRDELEEMFPLDRERILLVPDLWIHRFLFRLSSYLPRRVSVGTVGLLNQLITQFCQRDIVQKLIRELGIDIIHQPIPVAPRFPSVLFGLGVPVVIGPLNGGMEYPRAFHRNDSLLSRLAIATARLFVNAANTLLPGKKYADVVLVANERTRRVLPSGIRGKVVELVENGIDLSLWRSPSLLMEHNPRRFVFLGRMVDWKAVDVVVRALVKVPSAELELIGDGPMLEEWRALANDLGVADRVMFTGWLPQQECPAHLQAAVALVLPSVYECGGAVVLEAMAMGKPVIATHWGGPADYLDASCGMLIEPESYQKLVDGFAAAMRKLIDSPALAKALGDAGRERAVQDFDWRCKIDKMIRVYRAVLDKTDVPEEERGEPVSVAFTSERR